MEEPGEHLGPVLGGDDLVQLEDGGEAEPPVAQRLDRLRVPPHEAGGDLAVVSGTSRQTELAVEKVEEVGVAELDPEPSLVELGEGEQEVAEGLVLAAEEPGQPGGEIPCSDHASSIA